MTKKITELPASTTPVNSTDVIPFVDLGSTTTKKATLAQVLNNGIVATLTGAAFSGPVNAQVTGSLTQTNAGTPFITSPAGNIITISTGSNGQIVVSGSGGVNIGAPRNAQYLTLVADPELSLERVFTPGTGLLATDAGGGNAYTLRINDGVVATVSGTFFTGPVTGSLGLSGSHLAASDYLKVGQNPGSIGQVRLTSVAGGAGGVFASNMRLIAADGSGNISVGDEVNSTVVNVFGSQNVNLGSTTNTHLIVGALVGGVRVQTWFKIADSDNTAEYVFSASNLSSNRGVILPALSASSDTFVFEQQTQTLTSKTLTSPSITNPTITGGGSWASPNLVSASLFSPTITGAGTAILSTLTLGVNAATSGSIRMPKQSAINFRNDANNADTQGLFATGSSDLMLGGASNTGDLYVQGGAGRSILYRAAGHHFRNAAGSTTFAQLAGAASDFLAVGATPATTGSIRLPTDAHISFRSGSNAANVTVLKSVSFGNLYVGGDDFFATNGPERTYVMGRSESFIGGPNSILKFDNNGAYLINGSLFTTQGTAAQSEIVRFGQSQGIAGRNAANTADIFYIGLNSNDLLVGKNSSNTAQAPNLYLNAQSGIFLQTNAATRFQVTGSAALCNVPLTASLGVTGSFGNFTSASVTTDSVIQGRFVDPATCGHRLTITSGTAVPTSDVLSGSTVYLTPHTSDRIALYDGTRWVERTTNNTQASIALSGLTIDKNYDVFAYDSSGTVTLELSNAWTDGATRSQALTRRDGVLVKSGAETRKYVGTIRTNSTTSVEDSVTKRHVWNFYNRVERSLKVTESTNSWSYSGAARPYNNNVNNSVQYVCGETIEIFVRAMGMVRYTASDWGASVDIGVDSTSVGSATLKTGGYTIINAYTHPHAEYRGAPGLGWHTLTMLERAANNVTFYGDNNDPTYFQCGMMGYVVG